MTRASQSNRSRLHRQPHQHHRRKTYQYYRNLKLAQKLLGHSNINMTADVYTHISQESEREAARAVERAIYGDLFPSCSSLVNGNKTAAMN